MERGWFRAYVLYLDDEPIAFWQGQAYNGVFSTGVPGFDPAYAEHRVGNYVLFKLIADLCADESIDTLDYGFGDAEYKRRFGTRSWEEQDVHLFAPTAKGFRTNAIRSSLLTAVAGEHAAARAQRRARPDQEGLARPAVPRHGASRSVRRRLVLVLLCVPVLAVALVLASAATDQPHRYYRDAVVVEASRERIWTLLTEFDDYARVEPVHHAGERDRGRGRDGRAPRRAASVRTPRT